MKSLKVALIGFGGIARAHNAAYKSLAEQGYPISVTAVCEKDLSQITASISINIGGGDSSLSPDVHLYSDVEELINNEDFDIADVCLPTFLHKDFSIRLLRAGKHVLCEKPMALNSSDCKEMLAAASESGRVLMIGQCLRYDSFYRALKAYVSGGELGALRHLYLYRHSVYPRWGSSFAKSDRTGGCILDTHIHDVDIARFLLGEPQSVSAVYYDCEPHTQTVNTRLFYPELCVVADCSWDESREKPFEAGFRATFEGGNVIFDGERLTVYPLGSDPIFPDVVQNDRIADEIRAIADAVLEGKGDAEENPAISAYSSVLLVERLAQSARARGEILSV